MIDNMIDLSECPKLIVGDVYDIHTMNINFEARSAHASYSGYQNLPYEKKAVLRTYVGMFMHQEDFVTDPAEIGSSMYKFFVDGSEAFFDSHTAYFVRKVEEPDE